MAPVRCTVSIKPNRDWVRDSTKHGSDLEPVVKTNGSNRTIEGWTSRSRGRKPIAPGRNRSTRKILNGAAIALLLKMQQGRRTTSVNQRSSPFLKLNLGLGQRDQRLQEGKARYDALMGVSEAKGKEAAILAGRYLSEKPTGPEAEKMKGIYKTFTGREWDPKTGNDLFDLGDLSNPVTGLPQEAAAPTATGPKGEKLILSNGQWVPIGGK